jgi:hypothetical protein
MLVEATQTFFYASDQPAVRKGHIYDADHPLVSKFPGSFRPLEARDAVPAVEQATKGPGERSTATRPKSA